MSSVFLMSQTKEGESNMVITTDQIDIRIDKKEVYRYLGYSNDSKPPERILSLIDEYVEEAHHLIEPSYSYVIRGIECVRDSHVFVEGSIVFTSEVIARLLRECTKVAVILVTIDKYLEETACRLAEDGLIVQAMALDAVGSAAVEKVADFVQDRIREVANEQGLATSRRFSPGYCDWNISQQKALFRAVNGNSTVTRLTNGYLMIPQKSMSSVVGIGPSNGKLEGYNPCTTCDKDDCHSRRQI